LLFIYFYLIHLLSIMSARSCQTQAFGWKKIKIFQKHDWTAKTNIISFKHDFFYLYAVEPNCKFFFICPTYFINLLYSKRKEWKKCWVLSDLFQVFKNKLFFLYALRMKILVLYFHLNVEQFFKGFMPF